MAMILKLEAIDDARRHQYGGGKPRNEIVQPRLAGAVTHGIAPRRGNKGLFINTLRPNRFQARELASTLDEGGLGGRLSSSGQTEMWLHGHDLWGKPQEITRAKNYMVWPGIMHGPSQ